MERLPVELLGIILKHFIYSHRAGKNEVLRLRPVCKAFDIILRPYLFKTIQLEFTRFNQNGPAMDMESLGAIGDCTEAMYCDMMVVRDAEELDRLMSVFESLIRQVPDVVRLNAEMRKYCMDHDTFEVRDFARIMSETLQRTPKISRLELNLPFQVIGKESRTATMLLATTIQCFRFRSEESRPLQTLVIDHISDSTLLDIYNNPTDLGNMTHVCRRLKNMVLSIKRQELGSVRGLRFESGLWFMVRSCILLESLCLIGWNTKRKVGSRRQISDAPRNEWLDKSLPYRGLNKITAEIDLREVIGLKHLRYLELKRLDIKAVELVDLIRDNAPCLKELYLIEVYLKVEPEPLMTTNTDNINLWVGHGTGTDEKPAEAIWIAEDLRALEGLQLEVLRATSLGYDVLSDGRSIMPYSDYDINDKTGSAISLDQRFVNAYWGITSSSPSIRISQEPNPGLPAPAEVTEPNTAADAPVAADALLLHAATIAIALQARQRNGTGLIEQADPINISDYDAEAYQAERNPTSKWKRCIDGIFFNHNDKALSELQKIIGFADRAIGLLSEEITRLQNVGIPE